MITLFTTTKDFTGVNRQNQLNAIRCWLSSPCQPEVIIFGKSSGIEEIGEHPNLKILEQVRTSSSGVPYVNEMFNVIFKIAKYPVCGYVNADILLPNNFFENVLLIHKQINKNYLIVGERIDADVDAELTFDDQWEKAFRNKYQNNFKNHLPYGSDFFIFPKGQYNLSNMPELLIGRPGWDNVMIYNARKRKFKTIDISDTTKVFHQNHPQVYSTTPDHPDNIINLRHLPDDSNFKLSACNYTFSNNKLVKNKARGNKHESEQIELSLGNVSLSYWINFHYNRLLTQIKKMCYIFK
jgi:hypothetical protein